MARSPLSISQFSGANGPVVGGYILVRISDDAKSPTGQICAQSVTQIALDSNGSPVGSPLFWPNAELAPSTTTYLVKVFTATGQQVAGPMSLTV